MENELRSCQGFNTLQLSQEVKELLLRLNETPENFTGRIIFMSMFNDISWGSKDNKKRVRVKCSTRFSICKKIWSRTIQPFWKRLRLFLRTIVSANQLSIYGAVAEMCEEYETLPDRTGQPVVGGQSSSSLDFGQKCLWIVMTWFTKIFYCATVWRTN